jgi:uncharacterized protein YoxC
MKEIPSWWLFLSGLFFFLNAILCVVGIVAVVYLIRLVKELGPRIESLEAAVRELIFKVHAVADRVEEVAASVRDTVRSVGGQATHVAGAAGLVATAATKQFDRIAPVVSVLVTAFKIFRVVQGLRNKRGGKGKGREVVVYKR